jgi:hypothetical protein
LFRRPELEQHRRIVDVARQLFDGRELLLDRRPAPVDCLRLLAVVPEARR